MKVYPIGCCMTTAPSGTPSSTERSRPHRQRRRLGTRCITIDVSQSERERGYLSEAERDKGAAIKKAIESVLSDLVFELQSEIAERSRARV
jgi:hypothetical protein